MLLIALLHGAALVVNSICHIVVAIPGKEKWSSLHISLACHHLKCSVFEALVGVETNW